MPLSSSADGRTDGQGRPRPDTHSQTSSMHTRARAVDSATAASEEFNFGEEEAKVKGVPLGSVGRSVEFPRGIWASRRGRPRRSALRWATAGTRFKELCVRENFLVRFCMNGWRASLPHTT